MVSSQRDKELAIADVFKDPLLAKVLQHAPDRSQSVEALKEVLTNSAICGPPTNLDFLLAILESSTFQAGETITQFLTTFEFHLPAIDVLSGGAYTLIQDYPGRPTIGRGFGRKSSCFHSYHCNFKSSTENNISIHIRTVAP